MILPVYSLSTHSLAFIHSACIYALDFHFYFCASRVVMIIFSRNTKLKYFLEYLLLKVIRFLKMRIIIIIILIIFIAQ